MLSSRFLRPHEHDEKHGRAYQVTEAGYEWLLAQVREQPRVGDEPSSARRWCSRSRFSSAPSCCSCSSRRDSSRARTTGSSSSRPRRRRARRSTTWSRTRSRSTTILQADTNIAGFYSAVGGSSTVSGTNQGRLLIGLKPRDERVERRRDDQGAAAEAREGAGHRRLHAEPAADSDRRARVEEPVSVHDAELRHRDAVSGRRRSSSRKRASRRCCRT